MMTETVVNVQEAPNNNAANKPQTSEQPLSWIKINLDYFKTTPGIIKLVELVSLRNFRNSFLNLNRSSAIPFWSISTQMSPKPAQFLSEFFGLVTATSSKWAGRRTGLFYFYRQGRVGSGFY